MTLKRRELFQLAYDPLSKLHRQFGGNQTISDDERQRLQLALKITRELRRQEWEEGHAGSVGTDASDPESHPTIFFGHSYDQDKDRLTNMMADICSEFGLICLRGDEILQTDKAVISIAQNIQQRIKDCDLFLGLLSDRAPKDDRLSAWVIFEFGMAYAYGKPCALIAQESLKGQIYGAFSWTELSFLNNHEYYDNQNLRNNLKSRIHYLLRQFDDKLEKNI